MLLFADQLIACRILSVFNYDAFMHVCAAAAPFSYARALETQRTAGPNSDFLPHFARPELVFDSPLSRICEESD